MVFDLWPFFSSFLPTFIPPGFFSSSVLTLATVTRVLFFHRRIVSVNRGAGEVKAKATGLQ